MAERVDGFPPGVGKLDRYPEEWWDGSIWEIVPGEDMRAKTAEHAKRSLYAAARRRDLRIRCLARDGLIYMQVIHDD